MHFNFGIYWTSSITLCTGKICKKCGEVVGFEVNGEREGEYEGRRVVGGVGLSVGDDGV